ncbi:hypothetical protein XENOCAPTIV_007748 [Xenoophorus captivus]|uniref:Cytosolic beta-glucosidase n=1 Tax=Xenoophorus captivus TaxID=1517983 RepID=A0ABV0QHS0_9TELE
MKLNSKEDDFSISVSPTGVQYYNRVIDDLLACNVSPMVTLYHFDLPQAIQNLGGWKSPGVATLFDSYSKFCFQTFGDRVKLWITINEPHVCARLGHEVGIHAPGLKEKGTAAYLVGHNMLRSHAMAWHSYYSEYRATQKGAVSLALNSDWFEPLDPLRHEDVASAERDLAFTLGWFAWPVFITGDYPELMRSAIETQSKMMGYSGNWRLPRFSKEDLPILGTADFFALNYYTSRKVKSGGCCGQMLSMKRDLDAEEVLDPSWPISGVSWLAVGPLQIEDVERCKFYRSTISEVVKGTCLYLS